jgi:5-formyltetrahydrofolate cyclo-ligase
MQRAHVARWPGAVGRIPNFVGATRAADNLTRMPEWQRARRVAVNPDMAQRPVREAALRHGKILYMSVPRLRTPAPFVEVNPAYLRACDIRRASTIAGALQLGCLRRPEQLQPIDLMIVGCVAASRDGARLGKGRGYSDLAYAILRTAGRVGAQTPVITTVHAAQLVAAGRIAMAASDAPLDAVVTPWRVYRTWRRFERPRGLDRRSLTAGRLRAFPVLRRFADR